MAHKYLKHAGLAAIALGCSMGIAVAQTAPPPPSQSQLDELTQIARKRSAAGTTPGLSTNGSKKATSAPIALGWNYSHATHCGWFQDSNGGQWYYILPQEGGIIYSINNQWIDYGLMTPCGEGYWIAWHVIDSTSGAYDQTYSYDFR